MIEAAIPARVFFTAGRIRNMAENGAQVGLASILPWEKNKKGRGFPVLSFESGQQFCYLITQCLFPQVTGHNLTLPVHKEIRRNGVDAIKLSGFILPVFQVGDVGPGKFIIFNCLQPTLAVLI